MNEVNPNGVFFTAEDHELVVENCTVEATPPQWTKEPPSAPGHYWVWQPVNDWPCHGDVMLALVDEISPGRFRARSTSMPFAEYIGPLPLHDCWQFALWLGPIPAPELPAKDQR